MDSESYVIVRVGALDDLCGLVDQASDEIDDVLARALRGAVAEIRTSVIPDPVS